ncbi:MAG: DUF58 domain-containing protein [Ruminococcus sp.]
MIKNIVIYLLLLISAFVFNVFYFGWFSWFLFVLTIAVPLVSLLVSLPFMIGGAVNGVLVFTNDSIKVGDDFYVGVTGKKGKAVFCPRIKIKLNVKNDFCNFSEKLKIMYSGTLKKPFYTKNNRLSKHCGSVNITAKYAKIYDFTGIFFIPIKLNATISCDIMPKTKKPSVLPDSSKISIVGYKPKNGGFSDYYELRQYQSGDSLKNIHWKLSSKYDDLIVREPSTPIYRQFYVRLLFTHTADVNDDILARFMYVCNYLNKNGSPCLVFNDGREISSISNPSELKEFIKALYRNQPYNTHFTDSAPSLVYAIGESSEEVNGV